MCLHWTTVTCYLFAELGRRLRLQLMGLSDLIPEAAKKAANSFSKAMPDSDLQKASSCLSRKFRYSVRDLS